MELHVDNVSLEATKEDLEKLFKKHGVVTKAKIIHRPGRSKAYGFVKMETEAEDEAAMKALNDKEWKGHQLKVSPAHSRGQGQGGQQPFNQEETPSQEPNTLSDSNGKFHNPYTFVPTPPRDNISPGVFAGDFNPLRNGLDHATLKDDLWTGHIPIKLTTVTPLVLLKTDGGDSTDIHQTYDVLDYLPESSLRGMLRSAYEVVTNSRYACFGREHKEKLAYRMDSRDAPQLIPAIIKNGSEPGKLVAQLCTGTSIPEADGPKKDGTHEEGAVYAAMFNPYDNTERQTECDSGYKPKTGDEVWAQIVLCKHINYRYWKAIKVWETKEHPDKPIVEEWRQIPKSEEWTSLYTDINNPIERVVKGHVLVTNKNIKGKHDERIFFTLMSGIFDVTSDLNEMIQNKENILKIGEKVWAEVVLYKHEISPKENIDWFEDYLFWKVVKIWSKNENSKAPEPTGKTPETSEEPPTNKAEKQSYYSPVDPEKRMVVEMYVSITSENMGNTHNERIFLTKYPMPDVTHLKTDWEKLIKNYQDAHSKKDIFHREDRRGNSVKAWERYGDKPGETAWAPHLYQDSEHWSIWQNNDPHGRTSKHDAIDLRDGDLVYASCKFNNGKISKITHLVPVSISRMLYDASPQDLLPHSLRPAKRRSELSPADRLFGWVAQPDDENSEQENQTKKQDQERDPYKGRIRVVCDDRPRPHIIERFEDNQTLPLTILGQPKPEQARFYVAKDDKGTRQKDLLSKKQAGYSKGKGLRGRKQYWHHKGLEAHKQADKPARDYWKATVEDRTKIERNGRYQEYRRPDKCPKENPNNGWQQKDSQNRSIIGWIKPGTEFRASLYVQNLQDEEVGALLWLLSRSKDHYFRLGYGKPLGFGSVKMEIDCQDECLPLGTDKNWQEYYAVFDTSPPAKLNKKQRDDYIRKFQKSLVDAYDEDSDNDTTDENGGGNQLSNRSYADQLENVKTEFLNTVEDPGQLLEQRFKNLSFIKEFLQILKGPKTGAPIHYPRTNREQDPEGKNFEWFTQNERNRDGKFALPSATNDKGLPYEP